MLVDTHLHLIDEKVLDPEAVIKRAMDDSISYFVLGGTNMNDNFDNLFLAKKHKNIYLACGIHPSFCEDYDIDKLDLFIKSNLDKIVAIGEIGLDYHYGKEDIILQKTLFEEQLKLATKYHLPVVIHSRDAISDTTFILSKYQVSGVIHCFSESIEVAREYIKLGFKLGIGGVVTFKNSKLGDSLKQIPISNIVLETDSPYLSPIRGEINEPKNIKLVAEYLCDVYKLSFEDVCKITTDNAFSVFKFPDKQV